MCAPSPGVVAHTLPSAAQARGPLLVSHNSPASFPHSPPHHSSLAYPTPPTNHPASNTSHSPSALHSAPHPHLPPLPQLPIPLAPTPVRVLALSRMLSAHPQHQWVGYLLCGLSFGFSTGYTGPHHPRHSHNLPSAASRPEVISSYIAKECASGHTAGPFMHPPFPNFIVNPLGAVPKKCTGKWRLIMHLSFPPGASINDGIDIANFPLRYSTVADAMDSCMRLGRGALMAKLDVQSAFRLCPVRPDEHHLLGMGWQGRYFFDRVLPFGLRSAPFIFNTLAEALEWIARQHGLTYIHHYLDDFFVAGAPDSPACSAHLHALTSLCNTLGIPLAKEKLEGPATQLEYLGILLDTDLLEARLPLDKLHDLKSALSSWLQRSSCTKRDLLSLIGTLSFAAKIVPAGRTFFRRLLDLSSTTPHLNDLIQLDHGSRLDFTWWNLFTTPWAGRSFFLLPEWTPAPHIHLYTDSSGSIGFGAFWEGDWLNGRWSPAEAGRSIQFKELYPITLAAAAWGHRWGTLRVLFLCDNRAVVDCIHSGTSHCPHMMHLLRNLFLLAAQHNFTISARHIPGLHNPIADALSHFHMQAFRRYAPHSSPQPTPIPPLPFTQI